MAKKPPGHTGSSVQKVVKSALHFNILLSVEINKVNSARAKNKERGPRYGETNTITAQLCIIV